MENGNFSQSGKRQAQRIDFRQEKGGTGDRAGPAHTGGKCAKIHCAEKVFPFFFICLAKQRGGKRKEKLPPARWLLLFAIEGAVCSWAWQ